MEPKWGTHAAAGCADPAYRPWWGYPWDGPAGSLQEPRVGGPWVLDWWSVIGDKQYVRYMEGTLVLLEE